MGIASAKALAVLNTGLPKRSARAVGVAMRHGPPTTLDWLRARCSSDPGARSRIKPDRPKDRLPRLRLLPPVPLTNLRGIGFPLLGLANVRIETGDPA